MSEIIKDDLVNIVERIYQKVEKIGILEYTDSKIDDDVKIFSEYLNVTPSQAIIVACFINVNFQKGPISLVNLAKHLNTKPLKFISLGNDIKCLLEKGIILKSKPRSLFIGNEDYNSNYIINSVVSDSIVKNIPIKIEQEVFNDLIEVLSKVYDIITDRNNEKVTTLSMLNEVYKIIENQRKFTVLDNLLKLNLSKAEITLFLAICWKTVIDSSKIELYSILSQIYDSQINTVRISQSFYAKKHILLVENLVDIEGSAYMNDTTVYLTQKSIKMLEDDGLIVTLNKSSKNVNYTQPEHINYKTLFYNESEEAQISLIKKTLLNDNFISIQERLSEKNLPSCVTAILFGAPGTGKTESVYQIAKETGRNVIKVDISNTKSLWFGESEKKIKQIFTGYYNCSMEMELCPILLFNEADAVLSKRRENMNSQVSQTENAIQNILLEELENFKGIFFATTNLYGNLDLAFERRFLFKVQFELPDEHNRYKIWETKLNFLDNISLSNLSSKFNFSGGQIDNIVRKCELEYVLSGTYPDFDKIIKFCLDEKNGKSDRMKIGFFK